MRPLELRLRNFRSFFGEGHTFDFRDRRLIGVVGPIGSGKSSMLDAVAFALYGRTPRINRARRTLIHQRADHTAVALRFRMEGEVWEAVRTIRRVGASQHALYRLSEDVPGDHSEAHRVEKVVMERSVNRRIVELLGGLDYEGFGRSVMLAQGQFAQLLSARPAERDNVLKGVFGYERVGTIRQLAREAVRGAEHEIEKLDLRIEHAEAARVRLDERKEDLAGVELRLETLQAARPVFDGLAERIDRAARIGDRAAERLARLAERSGELPDPVRGEQLLDEVERARLDLAGAEQQLVHATERLEEAESARSSEEFADGVDRLDRAERVVVDLERGRDRVERRLAGLRERSGKLPDRVRGIQVVASAELAWAKREQADRDWEAAVARLRELDEIVESDGFTRRVRGLEMAGDLMIELDGTAVSARRAAGETIRRAEALVAEEAAEEGARSAVSVAGAGRDRAEVAVRETAARLREAEDRLQQARHADMAGTLRHGLTGGDSCPVCHQPVHRIPEVPAAVDTKEARAEVERTRSRRDEAEGRLRRATGAAQAAGAELNAAQDRVIASQKLLAEARDDEQRHSTRLDGIRARIEELLGPGDPADRLQEERADLDRRRQAARAARRESEERRDDLDAAVRAENRAGQALSDLRTRIGTLGTMLDTDFDVPAGDPDSIRTALASLHAQWGRTMNDLEGELVVCGERIDEALAHRTEAKAFVDTFRIAIDEARTARDAAVAVRDAALASEQLSRRRMSDLRIGIGTLGAVLDSEFRAPEDDAEALRIALGRLHTRWRRTVEELDRRVQEQRAAAEAAAARLGEERLRHGVEGSIEAALAEAGARREQIQADIDREEELASGLVELRRERGRRHREARTNRCLVRDLTDSRFIRFLLDEERATLAGLGSEHFERLSSARYRFTEDGKFDIVDLNSADAIRRADSLSGGETFLASLALALGLAEMVGRRGGRLDAFFLDEGFGTLDPEHLDLAMAGVESLIAHREQRLVVVVSHVPELRERIEDLIVLDKDPVTGDSKVAEARPG